MPAALCLALLTFAGPAGPPDGPPGEVLAEAGGESITRGRVALFLTLTRAPPKTWTGRWDETVTELEDRALMRRFLTLRRAEPEESLIDRQTELLLDRLGETPEAVDAALEALGVTPADVRAEAALPLAWEVQARRLVTPEALRDYFERRRRRFDGTALDVAQIFRPGEATAELADLRAKIEAGVLTFAEAARQYSAAPSAAAGGAVGPVRFAGGQVPPEVAAAAFALEVGAISEPVRSAAGTHLVTVTGVAEPGELSLEDVRKAVRRELKAARWDEQVARLRGE